MKKAGKRIAGEYVGILDGIQADLEFVKKVFGLKRHLTALDLYAHGTESLNCLCSSVADLNFR